MTSIRAIGFAHGKRELAQILTIHRQYIEGAKLDLAIVLAGVQRVEIRHAVDTENNGLAIKHKLLDAVSACRVSDPWVALGPIVSAASDQPDAISVTFNAEPIAVIFDFMKPLGTSRNGLTERWKAKFKTHSKLHRNPAQNCESADCHIGFTTA